MTTALTTPCIVNGNASFELPFYQRTVPQLLARQAQQVPDKVLIKASGYSNTYSEIYERTARFAATLSHYGVEKGDRVLVLSSNRPEVIDTFLACAWIGAIFTPINTASRGEQLRHAVTTANPRLIICQDGSFQYLQEIDVRTPELRQLWMLDAGEMQSNKIMWNGVRVSSVPRFLDPIPPTELHPSHPLSIIYTSGTTGPSKGVICSHSQFCWWAFYGVRYLGITHKDVLFTVLPWFHTNAIASFCHALLAGATYAFESRFSASRFWQQAVGFDATVTYLLGTMAHILLERGEVEYAPNHKIRIALSPASSATVVERFRKRFGVYLIDGYGSTETNHIMSTNIGSYEPGTIGRPTNEFEVAIVDDDDLPVGDEQPGEMLVRSKVPFSMSLGYFGMPEATLESQRNLWFHTGDIVVRRRDGVYKFIDRKKDIIRRRGENISSYEIEQALTSHPEVSAAAVLAVKSEVGDEEVMAYVQRSYGSNLDPTTLIRYLEPRIAYFCIPRFVEFVDKLPVTANGKVRKSELRGRGIQEATWDREAAGVVLSR